MKKTIVIITKGMWLNEEIMFVRVKLFDTLDEAVIFCRKIEALDYNGKFWENAQIVNEDEETEI